MNFSTSQYEYIKTLFFLLTVSSPQFPHLSASCIPSTEGPNLKEKKKERNSYNWSWNKDPALAKTLGGNQSTSGYKVKSLRFDRVISRHVPVPSTSGAMPHLEPLWACEVQFQDTDSASHRADTRSAGTHTQHIACEGSPWLAQDVMRYLTQIQTRYTQDRHRLDHIFWRHMNSTAHTRTHEKGTKKWVTFLVIYASQSFWLPRQPYYSTPPSSSSIKVPVSTCSSDIILSLYFFLIPLMKNESSFPANTSLSLYQASQSFFFNPLGTGRHPVAPPATIYKPPRKEWASARSTPVGKI